MPFQPAVNQELLIDGIAYRIAEHPAAPGMPYGQEGRQAVVYQLAAPEGAKRALKVFKPRYRLPALATLADRLAAFADLPGLQVCRRTVLTPQRHAALLRQHSDLVYAVLMPWVEGPTWMEVLLEKRALSPEQCLTLARSLADLLATMEQRGLAHCDLSGPNVMLPTLAQSAIRNLQSAIELVDVEQLYGPGLDRPALLPGGSPGYAHRTAQAGLWGPDADRFAGAVLLAEMLGWCDERVRGAAWGEGYFDPQEVQQEGSRCRVLAQVLQERWGAGVAGLFERAWRSDALADCPTFGEWLIAMPERLPVGATLAVAPGAVAPEGAEAGASPAPTATDLLRAQVQALMGAARQLEEQGILDGALTTYCQAQALAGGDPALAGLAREIGLVVADLERRQQPAAIPVESGQIATVSTLGNNSATEGSISLWLWPLWTVTTAIGTSLGYWLFNLVDITSFGIHYLPLIWSLADLVNGFTAGVGQWLILRRYLPKIRPWILACALGSAIGGLVGGSVWEHLLVPHNLTTASWGAISDLIGGLLRGISQWVILRRYARHSEGWILIVAVGWAMGWLLNGIWSWDKGWTIQGAVVGLVAGAITGAFLVTFISSYKDLGR